MHSARKQTGKSDYVPLGINKTKSEKMRTSRRDHRPIASNNENVEWNKYTKRAAGSLSARKVGRKGNDSS